MYLQVLQAGEALVTRGAAMGLLVGVGHHVPSQVLLVLGGEAAAGAFVWPQVCV